LSLSYIVACDITAETFFFCHAFSHVDEVKLDTTCVGFNDRRVLFIIAISIDSVTA